MTRAIDCLVNVDMGDIEPPEWMVRVKEDTFKAGQSFLRSPELPELLDDMDANGVERAILLTRIGKSTADRAQRFAARASRSLLARRRRLRPPAADADAAQPRVVRARPPCLLRRRRAELLGRRHVPARATPSTTRSTRSAASSTCRCA